jgi:hypothetical protein
MQLCAGGRPLGSGTDPSPPTRARSPTDVKGFSRLTRRPHDGRRADRRAFTLEGATEQRLRSPRQARNPCFAGDYRGSRSCATASWRRTGLAVRLPAAHCRSCLVRAATDRVVRADPRSDCASPSPAATTTSPTRSTNNSGSSPRARRGSCTGSYSGRADSPTVGDLCLLCVSARVARHQMGTSRLGTWPPLRLIRRTRRTASPRCKWCLPAR